MPPMPLSYIKCLHPSAANISRPRSAPTIPATVKLGACVTLPSIDLDPCLRLKILRRHSIGNKERRAEQSFSAFAATQGRQSISSGTSMSSRLAAMTGASAASVNATGFWECYAEIELQLMAAGQSVAYGEFANGDLTSGHPSFVSHGVNHGLSLWCGVRMLCSKQGCELELPGVHS